MSICGSVAAFYAGDCAQRDSHDGVFYGVAVTAATGPVALSLGWSGGPGTLGSLGRSVLRPFRVSFVAMWPKLPPSFVL